VTKNDLIDRLFADVGNLYKALESKQVQIMQLYQSCDELHAAVRELRSAKQVQQDAAAENWRPTAEPNPVAIDELAQQTKWHVTGVSRNNDNYPKHIANARVMIAKAGGHAVVRQLVKQGKLHAFLQASPVLDKGKVYQGGKVTLYNRGKHTATNAKRYSMVLHTTTQAREVINYFRSIGIPVKDSTK
jgi:hypothetical protein